MTKKKKWQIWERKVGEIFENIGFVKKKPTSKPSQLQENCFCLETINPEMQVDVFVRVDRNTWILVECRSRRNRSIKKWLNEVSGRCTTRQAQLKKALKSTSKVYGIAATSLRALDSKIQEAADEAEVALWHHGVVDYLRTISKGAGSQVKDLVLYRAGIRKSKYPPIKLCVQKWPDITESWFVGFISPLEIARAAFVYQRGQGFGEAGYQRFLRPKRIGEIAKFVKDNKVFPNSIVLALPDNTRLPRSSPSNEPVTLTVSGEPEGIKIIDGQHRFFGALASGRNPKLLCTLVKTDDLNQAIMFATVNGKQVSVSKGQLVALFGVPGFAAQIAAGVSDKDRDRIQLEEAVYRTLVRLNNKAPLRGKLNFFPGRPKDDTIPFKFLFDTVKKIAQNDHSGFATIKKTSPQDRAKQFGDKLAAFLLSWSVVIGEDFESKDLWFQPTMLSALIRTLPDLRVHSAQKGTAEWLKSKKSMWKRWRPRPEAYRGDAGARILAKKICKRLKVSPKFI